MRGSVSRSTAESGAVGGYVVYNNSTLVCMCVPRTECMAGPALAQTHRKKKIGLFVNCCTCSAIPCCRPRQIVGTYTELLYKLMCVQALSKLVLSGNGETPHRVCPSSTGAVVAFVIQQWQSGTLLYYRLSKHSRFVGSCGCRHLPWACSAREISH